MQTLATMIFDGVLERFPELRIGVIEQGAIWVPSWMRQMESAFEAFARHEERLQALSLRPSEYVRRQVRFTPYPTEDVGWIIEQAGPEVCLFSSDYPHVEGGRRPIERFEAVARRRDRRAPPALLLRQLPRPHGLGGARHSPPERAHPVLSTAVTSPSVTSTLTRFGRKSMVTARSSPSRRTTRRIQPLLGFGRGFLLGQADEHRRRRLDGRLLAGRRRFTGLGGAGRFRGARRLGGLARLGRAAASGWSRHRSR